MRTAIRTTGADRVARGLRGLSKRAAVLGVVAADDVTPVVGQGYMRSLKVQGPGWPPLRPGTVRQRIADGYPPGPPLVASGRLERALGLPLVEAHPDRQTFKVQLSYAGPVLAKRPVKLDRASMAATTRVLSLTLHRGYRSGT